MSDDIIKSGADDLTAAVTILGYTDRPGIAQVYVGNTLLFDGQGKPVQELEVRLKMPFHIHFVQPVMTAVWKDPTP